MKLLEDQQDRAQAQRTRLEHRIAQLEVSLREKNGNSSNGYVMRKYLRRPRRSSTDDDGKPRALTCESRRSSDTVASSSFHFGNSLSRKISLRSPPRRYRRRVSPAKSRHANRPSIRFCVNNTYRTSTDAEEAFICKQCQREVNEQFERDIISRVKYLTLQTDRYLRSSPVSD